MGEEKVGPRIFSLARKLLSERKEEELGGPYAWARLKAKARRRTWAEELKVRIRLMNGFFYLFYFLSSSLYPTLG